MNDIQIIHGDCLEVMRGMASESIDAVVTDPPYGLSFMGKKWDYDVPSVEVWAECLRVLKPGGHLLAFAGTRTQHRMACRIEDAGFEIRDLIMWLYGSGFPKSHDVNKAIDKAAGVVREVVGTKSAGWHPANSINDDGWKGENPNEGVVNIPALATDAAKQWQGWGSALKPACEPITMARKPFKTSIVANVLKYGTGAINVNGCRVGLTKSVPSSPKVVGASEHTVSMPGSFGTSGWDADVGRWPANVIHDGSEEVLAAFPDADGAAKSGVHAQGHRAPSQGIYGTLPPSNYVIARNDRGSAARFFYCAKADVSDRDDGLQGAVDRVLAMSNQAKAELARGNMHQGDSGMNTAKLRKNHHPTVKPTDLMRYLVRLVTPPGGRVLDPFGGSGSTAKACELEGFDCTLIEREAEYVAIARGRIASDMPLFAATMDFGAAAE